jgi:Tfp pilus assembly PilM family ATPase
MLRFHLNKSRIGIEITSGAARLAEVASRGGRYDVLFVKELKLPAGAVASDYAALNIHDSDGLVDILRGYLDGIAPGHSRRAVLSLPDSVFRVQVFEFDEFPDKAAERDGLIRWRFEKSAFDVSGAVIRHQVRKRPDKGFSVLACAAKQAVISQYEDALVGSGLEPWSVGISSLHALNFYLSSLVNTSSLNALAYVSERSCTTIVEDRGAQFYRYKEVKNGAPGDMAKGLVREIGDSLHFYTHRDRLQHNEVGRLYLMGDNSAMPALAEELRNMTSLEVEMLSPSRVVTSPDAIGSVMAAAVGGGCMP